MTITVRAETEKRPEYPRQETPRTAMNDHQKEAALMDKTTPNPNVLHFYNKESLTRAIVEGHDIRFLCGRTTNPANLHTKGGKPVTDDPEMGICIRCLGEWERYYGRAYRVTPKPAEGATPSVGERSLTTAGGGHDE